MDGWTAAARYGIKSLGIAPASNPSATVSRQRRFKDIGRSIFAVKCISWSPHTHRWPTDRQADRQSSASQTRTLLTRCTLPLMQRALSLSPSRHASLSLYYLHCRHVCCKDTRTTSKRRLQRLVGLRNTGECPHKHRQLYQSINSCRFRAGAMCPRRTEAAVAITSPRRIVHRRISKRSP